MEYFFEELTGQFVNYMLIGSVFSIFVCTICEPFKERHQRILYGIVFSLLWPATLFGLVIAALSYLSERHTAGKAKPSTRTE